MVRRFSRGLVLQVEVSHSLPRKSIPQIPSPRLSKSFSTSFLLRYQTLKVSVKSKLIRFPRASELLVPRKGSFDPPKMFTKMTQEELRADHEQTASAGKTHRMLRRLLKKDMIKFLQNGESIMPRPLNDGVLLTYR